MGVFGRPGPAESLTPYRVVDLPIVWYFCSKEKRLTGEHPAFQIIFFSRYPIDMLCVVSSAKLYGGWSSAVAREAFFPAVPLSKPCGSFVVFEQRDMALLGRCYGVPSPE